MNHRRPARIMMIEDNEVDSMRAREAFQGARFLNDIVEFEYAEAALEHLNDPNTQHPDLILLDLNLPGMSGQEFAAALKAEAELKGIPVVALTTSTADQEILSSWGLDVVCYIVKPVTLARLSEVMDQLAGLYLEMVTLPSGVEVGPGSSN